MARAPSAKVTQKVAAMVGFQWTPVTRLLGVLRTWGEKDCQGREGAGRVCHREGGWVMCRQVVGTPLRQPDHRRRLQLLAPAKVYFVYSSHLTQLLLYLSW